MSYQANWSAILTEWMVQKPYLKALTRELAATMPGQAGNFAADTRTLADDLFARSEALIVDAPGVQNIRLTSLVLASYRELLKRGVPRRNALMMIKAAFVEPSRKKIQRSGRLLFYFLRDPLKAFARISMKKQADAYGKGFTMSHDTDDMQTYFFTNVTRCLYHEFFKANDAPELTPIFCAYDDNWGDLLKTGEHGVRFERPSTLGEGGEACRFNFYRSERKHR